MFPGTQDFHGKAMILSHDQGFLVTLDADNHVLNMELYSWPYCLAEFPHCKLSMIQISCIKTLAVSPATQAPLFLMTSCVSLS